MKLVKTWFWQYQYLVVGTSQHYPVYHPLHSTLHDVLSAVYPVDVTTGMCALQGVSQLEQVCMGARRQEVLEEDTGRAQQEVLEEDTGKVLPVQWPLQAELSEDERCCTQ